MTVPLYFIEIWLFDFTLYPLNAVSEQKLRPHRSDDIFDYQLDFCYRPDCQLEQTRGFRKFVMTSVQLKNLPCLLRATAYSVSSLTQGRVAILLVGEGSAGKSSYLDFFKSFLSEDLISTVRFCDMAKETFKSAYIGKRINISKETNQRPMHDEDGFKSLISCEDTSGRFLYRDTQTIHSHAKFIFASNNDLVFAHPDDAIYDRLIVIPFTKKIPPEQKDLTLQATMEREKDIIMSMAIDTLKDLVDSKYDFKMSDDGLNYIQHRRAALHTIEDFLTEQIIVDETGNISRVVMFDAYKDWCKKNGSPHLGRNTFYSRIMLVYPMIREGKVHNLNSFIGIRFRNASDFKSSSKAD